MPNCKSHDEVASLLYLIIEIIKTYPVLIPLVNIKIVEYVLKSLKFETTTTSMYH